MIDLRSDTLARRTAVMREVGASRRERRGAAALVAVLALCPTAAALAAPQDFVCRGRDPGWELRGRGGGQATFVSDKGASRSLAGASTDLAAEGVVVWRGRASAGGGGADVVAVMLRGACTDPGAGEVSTYSAVLSLPNAQAVVGCCSYGAGAVPAAVAAAPPAPAAVLPPAPAPAPAPAPSSPRAAPSPEAGPSPKTATAGGVAVAAVPSVAKAEQPAARARPEPPTKRAERQGLKTGAQARVAGPAKERVLVRLDPSGRGRVAGSVRGGQAVVVGEAAPRGGQTWYRITGKGVPDRAWIRGDLLVGG